jgi:hypothetical protein
MLNLSETSVRKRDKKNHDMEKFPMEVNTTLFSFLAAELKEGERSGLYTSSLTLDFRNNTHNR